MAITHQTEIQLGRIFSPLTLSPGIAVEGGVADVQQYDVSTGTYTPDYTLTNLVLVPSMDVSDPDGIIPDGKAALTNMRWTLTEDGAETAVTSSTPGFAVAADGRLTVKRNCKGQEPMTLRFEAEYLDTRTGAVHTMLETHQIYCEGVSQRPVLELDTSGMIAYDPLRDGQATRKVRASFKVNGTEVPAANRAFVWQKRDMYDGVWADIDGSDAMDYDVSLSADGTELTLKLWLIGERIDIRCYAKYNPYGSPATVAIDSRTPVETFSARRIVGKLRPIPMSARTFRADAKNVYPQLAVEDSKGVLPNPDEVLDIEWRTAKCVASGALSKSAVVATGSKPTIPLSFLGTDRYGGKLIPAFGAKDPLAAIVDDGAVLVDDDGTVLIG